MLDRVTGGVVASRNNSRKCCSFRATPYAAMFVMCIYIYQQDDAPSPKTTQMDERTKN